MASFKEGDVIKKIINLPWLLGSPGGHSSITKHETLWEQESCTLTNNPYSNTSATLVFLT